MNLCGCATVPLFGILLKLMENVPNVIKVGLSVYKSLEDAANFTAQRVWYYQSGLSFYSKLKINQRIRWYYSSIKKLRLIGNESDYVGMN